MTSVSNRRVSNSAVAALFVAVLIAPATGATATPATDGFWYFDEYGIQEIHDSGITGKGVTIGVIDGQINLDVPTLRGADIEVQPSTCYDESGTLMPVTSTDISEDHGTNIVSYGVGSGEGYPGQTGVKGIVPDAKIIYTSVGPDNVCFDDEGGWHSALTDGIYAAIDAGADLISISVSGDFDGPSLTAITEALNKGVPIVNGDRNAIDSGGIWPNSANGVVVVRAIDIDLNPSGDSISQKSSRTVVVGPGVDVVWQGDETYEQQRYATGTSIATPIVAGFMALTAQKYPDATGNQLIQSLVRNTWLEDHELSYDSENYLYGYGEASARHMLRVDPTQYDDVNLLIRDSLDETPTLEQIQNPPPRVIIYDDEPIVVEEPADGSMVAAGLLMVLGIGLLGLLVVAGIITLIIVLVVRRGRNRSRTTPQA